MFDSPEGSTSPTVSPSNGHAPVDGPIITAEESPATTEAQAETPAAPAEVVITPVEPVAAPAEVIAAPVVTQAPAPPAPRKKGGAGRWIAVALIVIFVLGVAGGGGAYLANSNLSSTYSPQRAVLNYFAAQKNGDVTTMMADANFLRGDGSFSQFFDKGGLTAMMSIPQNRDISDVQVLSTDKVDDSTAVVKASMTWAGSNHTGNYTVHRNKADTHYFFYNSWTVDIPYTRISLTLPNQPGAIQIDQMSLPGDASTQAVALIAGYHNVTMVQTPIYDTNTQLVNGVDVFPNVNFDGKISASATAAIAAAITTNSTVCDAKTYDDCPGHTYYAPNNPGFIYFLKMPGNPEIDYNYYVFNYASSFTSGMTLTVPKDQGLVYAEGTCTTKLTVNGSSTYRYKGDWGANVRYENGTWTATVFPDCEKSKA